jgi:hypothetical protein
MLSIKITTIYLHRTQHPHPQSLKLYTLDYRCVSIHLAYFIFIDQPNDYAKSYENFSGIFFQI